MNTDSYFEIGSSHAICEDYAIDGTVNDVHFVIGSDGCSSSRGVDIGSKLLCHVAKSSLVALIQTEGVEGRIWDQDWIDNFSQYIRRDIVARSRSIASDLLLADNSFDATLLMAVARGKEILIAGWGDGVIIEKRKEKIVVKDISYEGNAPFYLSYFFSASRMSQYKIEHESNKKVIDTWTIDLTKSVDTGRRVIGNSVHNDPFCPYIQVINDLQDLKSISICSDGIGTYFDSENNPLNMLDFAEKFVDYKATHGEFVKRRMNMLKKKSKKSGTIHNDDIFCGTINLL